MRLFISLILIPIISMISSCDLFDSSSKTKTTPEVADTQDTYLGAKLVASVSALPVCDDATRNHLFYVIATQEFQVCDIAGYMVVNLKGDPGADGANGTDGVDGTDGATGINGADGTNGNDGVDGNNGSDGAPGTNGADGTNGTNGTPGETGAVGETGNTGSNGLDGINGTPCIGTSITEGLEIVCGDISTDTILDGARGMNGTNFLSGMVIPDTLLGVDGDTYLDITTGIYFKKELDSWEIIDISTVIANDLIEYLVLAKVDLSEIMAEGVTVQRLVAAGAAVEDFILAQIDAKVLFDEGVFLKDLFYGGFSFDSLTSAGLLGSLIDSRDQKEYWWVKIGNQIWMAQNLNYESATGSYCYDDDVTNCDFSGRMYTWIAAMNGESSSNSNPSGVQGICPAGWHFPSAAEWTIFRATIQNQSGITNSEMLGTMLKAEYDWPVGKNGTDNFGFSAVPGGGRSEVGVYSNDEDVFWWTSTQGPNNDAHQHFILNGLFRQDRNRKLGAQSVRCIKD